jgi:hypothetical protein
VFRRASGERPHSVRLRHRCGEQPAQHDPDRHEQRGRAPPHWSRQPLAHRTGEAGDVQQEHRGGREQEARSERASLSPEVPVPDEQRTEECEQELVPPRRRPPLERERRDHEQQRRYRPAEERGVEPEQVRRNVEDTAPRRVHLAHRVEVEARAVGVPVERIVRERQRIARRRGVRGEQERDRDAAGQHLRHE